MRDEPLLTSVVGSHARPSWFVSGIDAAERGEFGPADLTEMLDDAAREVEHSLVFFNEYQEKLRRAQEPNTFSDPAFVGRGVRDVQYSHAFVSLHDDDALVVEINPADASMWDVGLYNRGWYEPLDFANRVTSLMNSSPTGGRDEQMSVLIPSLRRLPDYSRGAAFLDR